MTPDRPYRQAALALMSNPPKPRTEAFGHRGWINPARIGKPRAVK